MSCFGAREREQLGFERSHSGTSATGLEVEFEIRVALE
jgi:hypothetical protein